MTGIVKPINSYSIVKELFKCLARIYRCLSLGDLATVPCLANWLLSYHLYGRMSSFFFYPVSLACL